MKLNYVHIEGYKNLRDTVLDFQEEELPIAIIGNNGTGKSNLVEALLHIFIGLYYGTPADFGFHVKYSAHAKEVEIKHQRGAAGLSIIVDGEAWSEWRFKAHARQPQQRPPFPAQVFTYYSGTCDRVERIVRQYNHHYVRKLRHQTDDLDRQFVFSGQDQANSILLGLIAHNYQSFLSELGVSTVSDVRLKLRSPDTYRKDVDDPTFWGTEGAFREFLAEVDNASRDQYAPDQIDRSSRDEEIRVYGLDVDGLRKVAAALERRNTNLCSMLQALSTRKLLMDISFEIVHQRPDVRFHPEFLSEGEKQLLCVIGGLTFARNDECLALLDEPDTHLNPSWTWRYSRLLKRAISSADASSSTAIIATHNPIMISGLVKEQVFIARYEDNGLIYEAPHRDPRGQGVANVLVSEYFGLPSSLDENTQALLDERLILAYKKEPLTQGESARLTQINKQLEVLGLSISFRDPEYKRFEEEKFGQSANGA